MKAYKVVFYNSATDRRYSRVECGVYEVEYIKGVRAVPNAGNGPLSAFDSLAAARRFALDMRPRGDNEIWECEVEPYPGKYPYIIGWKGSIACSAITLTEKVLAL